MLFFAGDESELFCPPNRCRFSTPPLPPPLPSVDLLLLAAAAAAAAAATAADGRLKLGGGGSLSWTTGLDEADEPARLDDMGESARDEEREFLVANPTWLTWLLLFE